MIELKTSTVESLLGVLSLGPMSGYEMRQFMERSTANFWSESFGQIYPALKTMLADGLIEVSEGGAEARTGKKIYRITAAGEERLRGWLGAPAKPQVRRHELLLKVFFAARAEPGAVAEHVRDWREKFAADQRRYEAIVERLDREQVGHPGLPYWKMTLRYGMEEAKFFLGWCDETLKELDRLDGQRLSVHERREA